MPEQQPYTEEFDPTELLVASRAGDGTSFAELHARMQPEFQGVTYYVRPDHEDVIQDAWMDILQGNFDPDKGTTRGWMFTILRRRAIDQYRKQQSQSSRESDLGEDGVAYAVETRRASRAYEPEAAVTSRQDLSRVLGVLTAEQVTMLLEIEENGVEWYANKMGISAATARVAINRQRHKLRKALESEE